MNYLTSRGTSLNVRCDFQPALGLRRGPEQNAAGDKFVSKPECAGTPVATNFVGDLHNPFAQHDLHSAVPVVAELRVRELVVQRPELLRYL